MAGKLKKQLVSIVYPAACCLCQQRLESCSDVDICSACRQAIVGAPDCRCPKCGATRLTSHSLEANCSLCREAKFRFERSLAIGNYRGHLKDQVLRMKRDRCDITAIQFGRMLAELLINCQYELLATEIDVVVPIPIHWWKRLNRGFHAADIISEGLSQATGIRKSSRMLACQRLTPKQGRLTNRQRFNNMKGAFSVGRVPVQDLTILLVDDVMTSGATADQATRVLLNAGAAKVFVAVVARGARVS